MKHFIFLIICIALGCLTFSSVVTGQESGQWLGDEIRDEVILPYFEALKNGNVDEIEQYLSEDLYDRNRRLFEENSEYPDFLRSYYRNSKLSVVKAAETMGDVEFEVRIEFPDGSQVISKLTVQRDDETDPTTGKHRWRISRIHS